jgi:CheY-like chemotaxis protein
MKKYNLLIVDDSELCRVRMKKMCKMNEKIESIIFAKDGLDALDKMRTYRAEIDVVLMDNQMPIMSGTRSVQQMREESFDQLIFGVTSSYGEDLKDFETCGVDYVFSKPFDKSKLNLLMDFLDKNGCSRIQEKKILFNKELEWEDSAV